MRNRALGQCSDCENGVMRALCGRKIGNEGVPACLPRGVGIRCLFNAAALVFALKVELDSGRRGRRGGRLFSFTGFRTTLPSERVETTNRSSPTSTFSILVTFTIRYYSKLLSRPHDCSITIACVMGLA